MNEIIKKYEYINGRFLFEGKVVMRWVNVVLYNLINNFISFYRFKK